MVVGNHEPVRPPQPPVVQPPVVTIAVTCCTDYRAHEVRDTELSLGLAGNDGCYRALCGHLIVAAPMVMPDGEPCPLCAALLDDDTGRDSDTERQRPGLRLPGLRLPGLRWILG